MVENGWEWWDCHLPTKSPKLKPERENVWIVCHQTGENRLRVTYAITWYIKFKRYPMNINTILDRVASNSLSVYKSVKPCRLSILSHHRAGRKNSDSGRPVDNCAGAIKHCQLDRRGRSSVAKPGKEQSIAFLSHRPWLLNYPTYHSSVNATLTISQESVWPYTSVSLRGQLQNHNSHHVELTQPLSKFLALIHILESWKGHWNTGQLAKHLEGRLPDVVLNHYFQFTTFWVKRIDIFITILRQHLQCLQC